MSVFSAYDKVYVIRYAMIPLLYALDTNGVPLFFFRRDPDCVVYC